MTLDRADFAAFFATMHDGNDPFCWQERLLDRVLDEGRWPEEIVAPTGSGKTAVIDVHVFACALTAGADRPAPPRRLALVVDRRVLVDDQYQYANALAESLADPSPEHGVLRAVAAGLHALRGGPTDSVRPLLVARLRGGAPPARSWREHPTAAAVICATPDMWGSRLLLRGYGSAARAWPREAGLLAADSVVVVDEAHLARQLLCSARRVAQLVPIAEDDIGVSPLQVVATTATPADSEGSRAVGVAADDLDDDTLNQRLTRPKPLALRSVPGWAKPASTGTAELVEATLELAGSVPVQDGASRTIGCFVNTVARAVGVAEQLRKSTRGGASPRVVLVCGQARPIDVELLAVHHPGLLSPPGNDQVDVLVSTQSLEVGVDLDLAGMVTELAGGSALAQRAGRVNRRGLRPDGPIVVTIPRHDEVTDRLRSGPYGTDDLRKALTWVRKMATDPIGLAPWAIRSQPPPAATGRRTLLQRPELAEAWHWARTSDDLAAEPELELWLTDDFAADTSVGVLTRALPDDPDDALRLVQALPPRRHEVFSVPTATARNALQQALTYQHPVLLIRGGDTTIVDSDTSIRPGDLLVLDSSVPLFTRFSPSVLVTPDSGRIPGGLAGARDVLEAEAELPKDVWQSRRTGAVVHRIELTADVDLLGPDGELLDGRGLRAAVRDLLNAGSMAQAAKALLAGPVRDSEVIVHRDAEDKPTRVIVVDRRRAAADEGMRQFWSPATEDVTLEAHQRDVANRAASLGRTLGLPEDIVCALTEAGAHHDDGKADRRFQRRLGADGPDLLAKSRAGSTPEQMRGNEKSAGLPSGWRHEQLSVLAVWEALADHPHRDLIARLVGTSHGLGRVSFPHTAAELLDDQSTTAEWLFDEGGWNELIDNTDRRYGVWGCAFLEAILRAADGQVSSEIPSKDENRSGFSCAHRPAAVSFLAEPTNEISLTGADVRVALHHLAAYGLVAILDDANPTARAGGGTRLCWSTGLQPVPLLTAPGLSPDLVDQVVRDHAAAHAESTSWTERDLDDAPRGLMSPRLSVLSGTPAWVRLQQSRHRELDTLTDTRALLDLRLLAALGEPCYWSTNRKGDPLQDDGASRWEMQPRNQGSEFVGTRLRKLAHSVAHRGPGTVATGLSGATTVDEIGGDKINSRTATGLAAPGPTDNALAWCALWGISQLPIAPRINATARTSCHLGRTGAGWFYLPVWHTPWTLAHLRTVLASKALHNAATAGLDPPWRIAPPTELAARHWLAARGVAGIIRFPVHRFGSASAPERRAMRGTPIPVTT
jgi:CRISPR-associated endonuclease/helicase Cas3